MVKFQKGKMAKSSVTECKEKIAGHRPLEAKGNKFITDYVLHISRYGYISTGFCGIVSNDALIYPKAILDKIVLTEFPIEVK